MTTGQRLDGTRLVILVDDDAPSLAALKQIAELWHWKVVACSTFEEARAALTGSAAVPDALVVDVRLGQFNGLQLILLARQQYPDLCVVAVSGFDDPVLRAEAGNLGASYLTKPIDLRLLQECLEAAASLAADDSAR